MLWVPFGVDFGFQPFLVEGKWSFAPPNHHARREDENGVSFRPPKKNRVQKPWLSFWLLQTIGGKLTCGLPCRPDPRLQGELRGIIPRTLEAAGSLWLGVKFLEGKIKETGGGWKRNEGNMEED